MQSMFNPSAVRSHLDQQLAFFSQLTRSNASALRSLSALQFQLPQQLLEDAINTGHSMLACKDMLQLSSTLVSHSVAPVQHWNDYQQQLLRVFSGVAPQALATAAGYGASAR